MQSAMRILEGLLGVLFLAAAGLKAVDMEAFALQISLYRVVSDDSLIWMAAYGAVCVEAVLGSWLVGAWRLKGFTHGAAIALTVVFSGLIVYGWVFHDLEDCGCFGAAIKMGPVESLLKNGILVALLGASWWGTRGAPPREGAVTAVPRGLAMASALAVLVLSVTVGRGEDGGEGRTVRADAPENAGAFAGYAFEDAGESVNLSEGPHLVALLSATCEHCQGIVPELNEFYLDADLPQLSALMLGTPEEVAQFEQLTEPYFPKTRISGLEFSRLVSVPPILVYVVDGATQSQWDWETDGPTLEELRTTTQAALAP